jgi:hypothetical protein
VTLYMHGWTPRGRATASATALLGPWPDSSIRLWNRPFALSSPDGTTASDVALVTIVPNIREGVVFAIKWSPRA